MARQYSLKTFLRQAPNALLRRYLEAHGVGKTLKWRSLAEKSVDRIARAIEEAHEEVRRGIEAEDPTPFKAFRRREYLETVSRMNTLADDADEATVLATEIVITAEVASVARHLSQRGLLVFGISDKPDEASLPSPEDATRGLKPLHRTVMKIHGDAIV